MTLAPDEFQSLLDSAPEIAHLASPLALGSKIIHDFRPRAHQKLISNAIVDAVTGNGPRFVCISVPQQFGKSFVSSFLAPAWYLELHSIGYTAGGLVGIVSADDSLPMDFSTKIRRLIAANPDTFFTKLRADSKAASYWQTEQDGGIIAVGVGGSIVGRPISLLILDDTIKNFEQAASEKHRETVWNFWTTVGMGRLQPWTVVLVISTRWREDDLIGRLLSTEYEGNPEDWKYIRLPLVCEEEGDPIGREIGQALMRPQWDGTQDDANAEAKWLHDSSSTYSWATLWQQNPADPEGTIFLEKYWRYYGGEKPEYELPKPTDFDQVIMSWDMAFKATSDTDFVVGQVWGGKDADRYLIEQIRGRWSFTETLGRVTSLAERTRAKYANATAILVEDKANGPAVIDSLRSKVGGLIEFEVSEYGSKEARAHTCQPLLLGGNLYIPSPSLNDWTRGYTKELADFPRGKNDDQVDATTQALLYMNKHKYKESTVYSPSDIDDLDMAFRSRLSQSRRPGVL